MEDRVTRHSLTLNELWWYTKRALRFGFKTNGDAGAGEAGPRTSYHESMGIFPTTFQVEVHAIERCDEINLDKNYRSPYHVILSHSQSE